MSWRWPALAAALAVATPGCFEPYAVHVGEEALHHALLAWHTDERGASSAGFWGPNTVETDYTYQPAGANPPYPGVLQVFGVRASSRLSNEALLALAKSFVDNATAARHVRVESPPQEGARQLANGLDTRFFAEAGTVTSAGLFPEDTKVRILGEVGYDGLSSTMVVVVAIAQVESSRQCPLIGACGTQADERTWSEVVGDPAGSVGGATSARGGLVYGLVTHG